MSRNVYAIDHVQLAMPTNGEALARKFYGELLGLEELAKPPNRAPSGIPRKSVETKTRCRRFGAYSDVSATTLGIAPPKPSPVRARKITISWNDEALPVSVAKIANMSVETTTGHLRPQRSATGPMIIEAVMKPIKPQAKTGVKAFKGRRNVSEIGGARKPMHCVSKPSRTMTRPHNAIVVI